MNWPGVQGWQGGQSGLARIPCLRCRGVATDVDVDVVAGLLLINGFVCGDWAGEKRQCREGGTSGMDGCRDGLQVPTLHELSVDQ